MKKIYVLLTVVSLMSVAVSSCSKDSIEADKEGIEMRMRNKDNGGDDLFLLKVDSVLLEHISGYDYDYYIWHGNDVYVTMSSSNNFSVLPHYSSYSKCDIASVGSVSGLSGIKKIPEGGWTNKIAVQPGQGYVIRHKSNESASAEGFKTFCRYARVYVVEWIEAVDGGIIGATIRYQDNWKIED